MSDYYEDKINQLETKISALRKAWVDAKSDEERKIIECRAKLLIWAKEKIEKKQQLPRIDLYETAKAIFSSKEASS